MRKIVSVLFSILFCAALLPLGGCAEGRWAKAMTPDPTEKWLDDGIVNLTYADVLMKFGPPSSVADADEYTFIAAWAGSNTTVDAIYVFKMLLANKRTHGWRITLMFHKKTKILMRYNIETR